MVGPASPVVFLGRLIVLITLESIVVLRVLVVRSAASRSGVMVCALQKRNNDALMGQATIANICEQENWVGPAFIFRLLNADTLTWQHASMFDSGWVLLTVLRLQIISSVSKVYGILHYINSCRILLHAWKKVVRWYSNYIHNIYSLLYSWYPWQFHGTPYTVFYHEIVFFFFFTLATKVL